MPPRIDAKGVNLAEEAYQWQKRKDATKGRPLTAQEAKFRTSLQNAPSGWTEEQIRQRSDRAAREAWEDHGMLVIRINDLRLDDIDRGMINALAKKIGFGCLSRG